MVWWKNEEKDLPPELQGKTPEQIAQAVKDSEANKAAAEERDRLKAENSAKENELNAIKAKLDDIEKNARQPVVKTTEPPSVLLDEEAAFNHRLKPATAIAMHAGTMAARMQAYQQLKARDKYIWDKFAVEIDDLMGKEQPERRIFPQTWLNALIYVKGVHSEDLSKNDFFAELGSSEGVVGGTRESKPVDLEKLTAEEELTIKRMKISREDYIAQKKAMAAQNQDTVWSPTNHPA